VPEVGLMMEGTLKSILEQREELRKHIGHVPTDVKTEKSVMQKIIKNDISAVKDDTEDNTENNISAVSVGQEEF
jgi:hypothetical protein